MRYRFLSDSHVHSDSSRDGTDPVTMMCERAAYLGLYSVTITDHCECDVFHKEEYDRSIVQSYFEARKAKAVFFGRLQVFAGIELGQPLYNLGATQEALDSCDFDFTLASIHNLPDEEDFYFIKYTQELIDPLLNRYFDEILKMAKWGRFDSLAHLTYPMRYMAGKPDLKVELSRYQNKIDEILTVLADSHKALEVNTSGLRQQIGVTLPDADVIRRFQELGGKYVTLGSDAHRWADLAAGIEQGMELISKAGFQSYTVFSRHEPRLIPIE